MVLLQCNTLHFIISTKIMFKHIIKFTFIVAMFAAINSTQAQENRVVDSQFDTWWSNVNTYNLHPKWYLSSELHIRRTNGFKNWQQFLIRPAANFKLNDNIHFALGYTYILSYPYGNQSIHIATPEHNVWEQVTLKHKVGKVAFSHRYRFEQRLIGNRVMDEAGEYHLDDFTFGERFRYRLTASIPITANKRWFITVFDEIWITQEDFLPTGLNQNWAYLGAGFKLTKRTNIQLGFMHQLIKKGDGIHFESNPTLQFTFGYTIGRLPETKLPETGKN
jgi:hypothetical protein